MSRSSSIPRRLVRVAAGAALLTGFGTTPLHAANALDPFPVNAPIHSQFGFSTAWDSFFDTSREVGLFHLYGCVLSGVPLYADLTVRSQDCIGVRAERGYELATGLGAVRILVAERQVAAGVDGGPSGAAFTPTLNAVGATGTPAGWMWFGVTGETVIRTSPFVDSDGLATLAPFSGGTVGHYVRFIDPSIGGGVWLSQNIYSLQPMQSVIVPAGAASTTAPEPGTWALLGTGLLAIGGIASRRKRAAA
jgi:hypothetical protein